VSIEPSEREARVVAIVAEALDVEPAQVKRQSSFIDDLGAESLDLLDIVFKLETAFNRQIPEEDIWKGSIDTSSPEALAEGVVRLRERMPDFNWGRLPAQLSPADLPRLITVQTILDYLEKPLDGTPAAS
jgi:acyl carrier protein